MIPGGWTVETGRHACSREVIWAPNASGLGVSVFSSMDEALFVVVAVRQHLIECPDGCERDVSL